MANNGKKQNEEITNLVPTTENKPSVKPKGMSDEDEARIKAQANKAVTALVSADGSEAMVVQDQIANIGIKDQKNVSTGIALLQEKMGNVFYSDNKSSVAEGITKDIGELQTVLTKINPKDIQKEARYRIIRMIPFLGNWMVNVLKASANRRITLQQFVDHLEESLKSGETMLRQDNVQLQVMYGEIEDKQKIIDSDAYFAEVLMEKLTEALNQVEDEKKKNSINKVLFKVATRAQDLRAMENIHEQFYTSIEMTRDNNDMLIATVQRMLTMGMNVVYIALAIHAALARQKNVIEAAKGTRDFIGNLIVSNATAINNHVKEIGDLYKEPVVAMDKLSQGIDQLMMAIDAVNRLKAEGVDRARENIVKIKVMTEDVKKKAGELPSSDIKSLEGSQVLQITAGK
jgi:uncharacterized protein YaaN involved in tellurite resistance